VGNKRNLEAVLHRYATNLTLCDPDVKNIFIYRSAAACSETPLRKSSRRTAYQRLLGARLPTLACAARDNTASHTTEAHLITHLETTDSRA
jgi:hypothetical protein